MSLEMPIVTVVGAVLLFLLLSLLLLLVLSLLSSLSFCLLWLLDMFLVNYACVLFLRCRVRCLFVSVDGVSWLSLFYLRVFA